MANEQMGMPAAAPSPEEMAVFDQMRQTVSPKEFSDEMLAGASQVDPQAVAEFKQELDSLDVPPEVLDALNDLVDEILANPGQYAEIRQKYMAQGIPEDLLPEQFDPQFFAALNMAIDQLIGAPAGEQAFAKGGIAELKPINKAIASYGRNGDTMLAHITPAEARMLKRRGGAGTINPKTGLPEFFSLGGIFKSIGNAVKKFASSTVGRIVTTVALGFFLGPAAASALGVSSAAGVAAVSGFVGSAGSTLLGGGSIRDALKAGAIGGLTAGATAGALGGGDAFASGSYTGPTTVSGQWDKFTNAVTPGAPAPAPAAAPGAAPGAPAISPTGQVAGMAPLPNAEFPVGDPGAGFEPYNKMYADMPAREPLTPATAATTPAPLPQGMGPTQTAPRLGSEFSQYEAAPGPLDKAKTFYNENISPSGIREAAIPGAQEAGAKAMADLQARMAIVGQTPTPAMLDNAYQIAYKAAMPGVLSTYGPAVGAGLGIMGLAGGFQAKPVQGGAITQSLMTPATERIRQQGSEKQFYVQGLPGVQYNALGEPVAGGFTGSLPTYDVPNYGPTGYGGQGIMQLPTVYMTPAGAMGSRQVAQPYNNALMYSNLLPRYAEGGDVEKTPEQLAAEKAAAEKAAADAAALAARQRQARDEVAQQKAMRRAQGYGTHYANINAGLSALAPEVNPVNSYFAANPDVQAEYYRSNSPLSQAQFAQQHFTQWGQKEGRAAPGSYGDEQFGARNRAAQMAALNQAYGPMLQNQQNFLAQQRALLAPSISTSGIAALAQGGYPRRNGQIDGPGTETSDSIPAMLSDGEFVMTAKAVRGMGNGSRRDGAKKMYKLMHQLERNAQRG